MAQLIRQIFHFNFTQSKTNFVLMVLACLCFCSCETFSDKKADLKFGEIKELYPAFGTDYKASILEKKLQLDFNQYAVLENSYVDLEFVNKDGQAINGIKFFVDGQPFKYPNYVRLRAKDYDNKTIRLGLQFLEGIEEKNHKGFIRIKNSDLDRVDDTDLASTTNPEIYRWTARYTKRMHPVVVGLLIFLATVLACLLLWFILFKRIFYPRFKGGEFEFLKPDLGSVRIKGYRKFIMGGEEKVKQGTLSKIFTGKIGQALRGEAFQLELNPHKKRGTIWTRYKVDSSVDFSAGNRGTFYNFEEYDFKDANGKKHAFIYKNKDHKRRF